MTTHGRLAFFFFQGSKIGAVIYPVVWYFRKLRAARAERLALEHLKVENMIVRIRSLQQQMSPHFLFNCLNVLKSGAKEEWAKEYVLTLSRIYRYLLAIDSQSRLASVAEEVRFIEDYVRVLNHRHNGLMKVCIEAGPDAGERFIPPLALRIVLDHLTGSDVGLLEMPAQVRIFTQADWLIAASDAPPWRSRRKSSRGALGLHNLQQHYQLLGSMPPVVAQEGALFTVKIPLFHDQGAYIGR
jgi:LytS/YehU family sensor histidine kinase